MPNSNGFEATRHIKAKTPDVQVVMLTVSEDADDLKAAVQCGADGYLLKDNVLGESLTSAIRTVRRGENVFDHEIGKVMRELAIGKHKTGANSGILTKRELQVLKLAARGISNKEIAAELCISDQTVATHFVNILRRFIINKKILLNIPLIFYP